MQNSLMSPWRWVETFSELFRLNASVVSPSMNSYLVGSHVLGCSAAVEMVATRVTELALRWAAGM